MRGGLTGRGELATGSREPRGALGKPRVGLARALTARSFTQPRR